MVDSNANELPPTRPTGDPSDEPGTRDGQPDWPAGEDAPIGLRVGRNPANVGDEVADSGDVVFPETVPQPAEI
jgi:hypothetical protein